MCCNTCSLSSSGSKVTKSVDVFLSSLLMKRRRNRESRHPCFFRDTLLNYSIKNIKQEVNLRKDFIKSDRKRTYSSCSTNDILEKSNCFSDTDDFFDKLRNHNVSSNDYAHSTSKKIRLDTNENKDFALEQDQSHEDLSIQDFVDTFIETVSIWQC